MRLTFVCVLSFLFFLSFESNAKQTLSPGSVTDSLIIKPPATYTMRRDSVALLKARQQFFLDSLATAFLLPNINREDLFIDSILKSHNVAIEHFNFLHMPLNRKSALMFGHARQTRDPWVIIIIIALLIYTALLNRALSKDFTNVLQAFYSKRVLTQVSREDTLINSWTFIGFFILFCLTTGLFLYQFSAYRNNYYSISGLQLFTSLSVIILVILTVKFLVLKFIGFVFNINKIVTEYLSVLYLTYCNVAFVFLPVCVCFSLIRAQLIPIVLYVAMALIIVIFVWQYLRSSVSIVSNFRFHKFYLFIYLCALEICPILILIKALDI